jgi:hypothetical protein
VVEQEIHLQFLHLKEKMVVKDLVITLTAAAVVAVAVKLESLVLMQAFLPDQVVMVEMVLKLIYVEIIIIGVVAVVVLLE